MQGADSVMIARGAMWNPSIFRGAGMALRVAQHGNADVHGGAEIPRPLPLYDVLRSYIAVGTWTSNHFQNNSASVTSVLVAKPRARRCSFMIWS
eukprot:COSAG05_NODE_2356_length_3186_cov_2.372530_4_plen_94_part_00